MRHLRAGDPGAGDFRHAVGEGIVLAVGGDESLQIIGPIGTGRFAGEDSEEGLLKLRRLFEFRRQRGGIQRGALFSTIRDLDRGGPELGLGGIADTIEKQDETQNAEKDFTRRHEDTKKRGGDWFPALSCLCAFV